MERNAVPIIHRLESTSSTQRVARDRVKRGAACSGHVIVADEQADGRGRHGRRWSSPLGGLYATFIVPQDALIAVRAAVSVARAIEALGVLVRLKWPNDLVVREKKLAGILIETAGDCALVGVGINLKTSPLPEAVCLGDLGVPCDRLALVRAIYAELTQHEGEDEALEGYRSRLDTLGRDVRVERGKEAALYGRAVEVDRLGRLIVETASGRVTVASGDCLSLRPGPNERI